jgi:Family of unknown function (DUF6428)
MKISEFKKLLDTSLEVTFLKPDGKLVPKHFHITEIGQIDKKYIDCGGTVRQESVIGLQLWESVDFWHRLEPARLIQIIELSETKLGIEDLEIEVEYQADTIGKYGLIYEENSFKLTSKTTACLAIDNCVIPTEKIKKTISQVVEAAQSCCTPGGGCC